MHPQPSIAIIGAGIGGMTTALALSKAGFEPTVFEQADELGEVGAGISLSPNAMKGLRFLGLEEVITSLADEPLRQVTRHYESDEILVSIDRTNTREEYGAGYLQLHRADLHAALTDAFLKRHPGGVVLNRRFLGLSEDDAGVSIDFEGGETIRAGVAIGADGLRSTVRQQVFNEDDPQFANFVAFRGLIPGEKIAHLELPEGSCVWAGPARIFVRYPVRRGALQNFVAFAKTDRWEEESWSKTVPTEELKQLFSNFPPVVQGLMEALPDSRCHTWGLFARDPLDCWVTERVGLLGDAAHPMLPWFGQGAACAIEDGVVLARAFAASADAAEALARYQAARIERVTLIHRESLLGGERLSGRDTSRLKTEGPKTEDTLGITQYDPATVSI